MHRLSQRRKMQRLCQKEKNKISDFQPDVAVVEVSPEDAVSELKVTY